MIKYAQIVLKLVVGYTNIVILQSKFVKCFGTKEIE